MIIPINFICSRLLCGTSFCHSKVATLGSDGGKAVFLKNRGSLVSELNGILLR